jgi:acyl carrier protein
MDDRTARLADFIRLNVSRNPARAIGADTPLVSSGLVDSLSLVKVLTFVEDEFHVVIPDEAATAEAMDSIASIVALMDRFATP